MHGQRSQSQNALDESLQEESVHAGLQTLQGLFLVPQVSLLLLPESPAKINHSWQRPSLKMISLWGDLLPKVLRVGEGSADGTGEHRGLRIRGQRSQKVKETQSPGLHSTPWPPESPLNRASLGSPSLEQIYPGLNPGGPPLLQW